jgi:conjugal transfer pilus assembly protein TraB
MPAGTPPLSGEFGLAAQPSLVRVAVAPPAKSSEGTGDGSKSSPQTVDSFLPVSFTRGILLGGLDAPTGGQAQTNPHPVLIRLSDNSVLPNRFRAEYRECFVIAAGYGDISSERAYLRTENLSCVRADGHALEVKIQGSVFGEDGKVGLRGRLVTKPGQMLANALMAGVISGIGQGISLSNSTVSSSALGTVATTTGPEAMRAGVGAGIGKALDRLATYYIKLAEQTFPIIEIDAGREIDVVLTKGVRIDGTESAKASPTALPGKVQSPDHFVKVTDDEE